MKYLNKIASVFCAAFLGLLMLTSCEGADLYNLNSPEWLSETIDSIADSKTVTINTVTPSPAKLGAADQTTGFWSVFTDDIKAEPGESYEVKFLNFGGASNWNNFLIGLRNAAKDYEYGVLRADNWCWNTEYPDGAQSDNWCIKKVESNDRVWGNWLAAMSRAECTATITNAGDGTANVKVVMAGSDGNTYTQEYSNIPVEKDDLYFTFSVDGCHLEFVDEFVPEEDHEPLGLVLQNVPVSITEGTELLDAMANVKGIVNFDGTTVTQEVTAEDLIFETIPNYGALGTYTLVALYNKTFLGANAAKPAMASAEFDIVPEITALEVTKAPTYYFYTSYATKSMTDRKLALNINDVEVKATYKNKTTGIVKPAALTYSLTEVDAKAGSYDLTITAESGVKATTKITVVESTATTVSVTPKALGPEDNSAGWWQFFTDDVKVAVGETAVVNFTNYAGGGNWNNWLVILRKADKAEYGVFRADNFAWRYAINPVPGARYSGGQADWAAWLAAMNGAKCTAYITNCNNGTADIQVVMNGTDGKAYYQYYLGTDSVDPADLYLSFTVDGSHIVFD